VSRALLGGLCLAAAASCSTPQVVTATNNFDRASDVDFLCLDTTVTPVRALPTRECAINPQDNSAASAGRYLFALVTQAERGEVAAVNLAASTGTALVDNTGGIPGYTFIPVGALPSSIVADVRAGSTPSSVWVASAADRTVERIDAAAVLRDPRAVDPGRVTARLPMNGAPHDLALDAVGGRTLLYATVPERGSIAVFDVTDPTRPMDLGFSPVTVPAASGDGGVDGGAVDGGAGASPGHPVALAVDPDTHRVYASDDRSNVIHVLEGSPLREVARLDAGVPTRALVLTGWARRVSCAAEAADPDHYGRARYLYATHASTGAVHVVDATRGERVSPNLLPAPNPERRPLDPSLPPERVALAAPAVSLVAINSLEYRGVDATGRVLFPAGCQTADGCRGTTTVDPGQLHGVFVAAVLRDGRVAVIDVDDYDAAARFGLRQSTATPPVPNNSAYRFIRHAPRASTKLTEGPKVASAPTVTALVRGSQRAVISDVSTAPLLACSPTREPGTGQACAAADSWVDLTRRPSVAVEHALAPDMPVADREASVPEPACGGERVTAPAAPPADPYAVRNEPWGLTWDAVIPGLDVYGGAFVAEGDRLTVEAPGAGFCTRGAFADDAFTARDGVSVVGESSSLPADREMCAQVFGTATSLLNRDFVIDEAFQDRLTLRLPPGVTAALVQRCFPQGTRFEVRTRNTWIAVGARAGYQTAVTADASGRCVIDAAKQAAVEGFAGRCLLARAPLAQRAAPRCLAGRVCVGAPDSATGAVTALRTPVFANAFFCLQVYPSVLREVRDTRVTYSARPIERDTQIGFTITGAWEPLVLPGGTFPVAARFAPGVERLYVVDTQSSGLIEYRTTPLARNRNFN
jgi:DNA-binding beta-propeller fold protein YncE